jgi:hypothetical protein
MKHYRLNKIDVPELYRDTADLVQVWGGGSAWVWEDGDDGFPTIELPDTLPKQLPPDLEILLDKIENDTINKPKHYLLNEPAYDCWDVMEQTGIINDHYVASAFQYLWRCYMKGQTIDDLRKAVAYIEKAILRYEAADANDQ